ncbi:MAG: hypothetical protein FWE87_06345 [Coriobacteriia bacterium]|nr:hypothetical protein [Coriobacteriia bacterium]
MKTTTKRNMLLLLVLFALMLGINAIWTAFAGAQHHDIETIPVGARILDTRELGELSPAADAALAMPEL